MLLFLDYNWKGKRVLVRLLRCLLGTTVHNLRSDEDMNHSFRPWRTGHGESHGGIPVYGDDKGKVRLRIWSSEGDTPSLLVFLVHLTHKGVSSL